MSNRDFYFSLDQDARAILPIFSSKKNASFVYLGKSSWLKLSYYLWLWIQPIYYENIENNFEIREMTTTKLHYFFIFVCASCQIKRFSCCKGWLDRFRSILAMQVCSSDQHPSDPSVNWTKRPNDLATRS